MRPSTPLGGIRSRERLYRIVFALGALYNLAFGSWVALWPAQFFLLCGVTPPASPALWRCIGMMVGVYAPAYLYAALRPWSARPLIAVALLGKLLGPIGWLCAVRAGELSIATFPLVALNDIAWWAPFVFFLTDPTRLGARMRAIVPWTCALVNGAAALWTAALLRNAVHGAPDEQLAFLESHLRLWRGGWALWMFAALSFVAFIGWWAARVRGLLAIAAFLVATAGLACDVVADAIYIGWADTRGAEAFKMGRLMSFGPAHMGYVIAGTLLTFADRSLSLLLRRIAWCIWALGAAAEVSILIGGPAADVLFGSMFVVLLPWVALMGRARARSDGCTGVPLRDLVPKHPLPMRCHFRECYLVNFAVDPDALRRALPQPLEPDLYAGKAWLSIVIADMVSMRPAFLPPCCGANYTQVVYRAVVRAGRERGVFFVRSDADDRFMCLAGNLLTRFRFHPADVRWTRRPDSVSFELASGADRAGIQSSFRIATGSSRTPPSSAFHQLGDARDFLVDLFQAFSVDALTGSVDRVRIERSPWDVLVVDDEDARYEFMQEGSLFNSTNARLDSVFRMTNVPYHWHTLEPAFRGGVDA